MYLAQGWCTLNLALSALASIFDILIFLRFCPTSGPAGQAVTTKHASQTLLKIRESIETFSPHFSPLFSRHTSRWFPGVTPECFCLPVFPT